MGVLRLESLTPDHADALYAGLSEDGIYEFIDDAPPASAAALRSRYERLARGHSDDGAQQWLNWAILDEGEGVYVGYVQATVSADGRAEVAYVVFPSCWGRGYGRESVSMMLELLRARPDVRELFACVDTRHARSRRLLESFGFRHVETRSSAIRGVATTDAVYSRALL